MIQLNWKLKPCFHTLFIRNVATRFSFIRNLVMLLVHRFSKNQLYKKQKAENWPKIENSPRIMRLIFSLPHRKVLKGLFFIISLSWIANINVRIFHTSLVILKNIQKLFWNILTLIISAIQGWLSKKKIRKQFLV